MTQIKKFLKRKKQIKIIIIKNFEISINIKES